MSSFAEKHPKAAQWIREGGLFIIFSYVVTFLKYLMLQFLPSLFSAYANVGWTWPGIPVTLFGVEFELAVLGNTVAAGGLASLSSSSSKWSAMQSLGNIHNTII